MPTTWPPTPQPVTASGQNAQAARNPGNRDLRAVRGRSRERFTGSETSLVLMEGTVVTYPPQPGHQPQGQYPGNSGVPNHPGLPSYPGGQYPQGHNPYGMQGGGWGPQQPPPKKGRTGLWVVLSLTAVAVVAFVITAFVAPGFLLDDDSKGSQGANADGDSAQALAVRLRDALNNRDTAALREMACPRAAGMVEATIAEISEVSDVELVGEAQEKEDTAVVKYGVTFYGEPITFENTLTKRDDSWCWQDLAIEAAIQPESDTSAVPGGPGAPGSPDAAEVGEKFLDEVVSTVNGGDTAAVASLVCPGMDSTTSNLEDAASSGVTYTADGPATSEADEDGVLSVDLTLTGDDGSALSIAADNGDGEFCVYHALHY